MVAVTTGVLVRLRNDRRTGQADEFTEIEVDHDLAQFFAYARCWAGDADRNDKAELTFSAMLAAMVAGDQPLSEWLRQYFDRLAVPSRDITLSRVYLEPPLYADAEAHTHLVTSYSFREAFALSTELRDEISPGQPVAVRHFMAAYAVCPDYHLSDFRKYRIDRREWSLSLADHVAKEHPDEAPGWVAYRSRAPDLLPMAFTNDTPDGWDRLHLEREVTTFARLIASRSTATPLSIGVFGAWGSGKSFFMRRTRERVIELAKTAAEDPRSSPFHSRIAQIEFNAWDYSEGDLIASLVDHVLRNLRIDAVEEDEAAVARRAAEVMTLLDEAKRGLVSAETGVTDASQRLTAAEEDLRRAQADLPEAVREAHLALSDAEVAEARASEELQRARQARDAEIERAKAVASGVALLGEIGGEKAKGQVQLAADSMVGFIGTGRELARRRWAIALGAALAAGAALFVALTDTELWARAVGAITAVGAIAAWAVKSSAFLGQLADRGNRFEVARTQATEKAAERIIDAHAERIQALEDRARTASEAKDQARTALESAAQTSNATKALAARRTELDEATAQRADAQRQVDALQADLDATSIDQRLAAFIDERAGDDRYRSRLGIFSQVRTDFDRLSRLMERATKDHFEHGRPPPTLSRIVLYIDDLDRCDEDTVVAVLRAVHLLLAFPLFVCIVAVDPRWLTTCLRHAPGVAASLDNGHATPTSTELDEQVGRPADPADYIEKIFQVPIWLRPVPEKLRPALVRSWLEDPGVGDDTESTPAVPTAALTPAELAFLDGLAPFLPGKPRTLKRLANTYRLVRTSISDVQFKTFTTDRTTVDTAVAPYRICLVQLAVLTGDRDRALRMVASLDACTHDELEPWLTDMEGTDPSVAELLRATLAGKLKVQEFRDWLERTRRYSYYL